MKKNAGGTIYNFNPRQKFTRFRFKTTQNKLDLTGLMFKRTDESEFKSAYQMMDLKQLKDTMKKTQHLIDSTLPG